MGQHEVYLSTALANEDIGLEWVDHEVWNIVYDQKLLGRLDERTSEISGAEV